MKTNEANQIKVEVDRITAEPLEISRDISSATWDLNSYDISFVDPIRIMCRFTRIGLEILIEADVTITRDIVCSRCLGKARQTVTHSFKKAYNRQELEEYLDVTDDIREEILLNFPMKVLCAPGCKGICVKCGANLNTEKCRC